MPSFTATTNEHPPSAGVRVVIEPGDRFPSLIFPESAALPKSLRLDPFLRREGLHAVSRIAISPTMRMVALSARSLHSKSQVVLRIDRASLTATRYELEAYDLVWLDNHSLLVTTRISGKPRELHVCHDGRAQPQRIHFEPHPAREILLEPNSHGAAPFIKISSPTDAAIFMLTVTNGNLVKLQSVLPNDLPQARCTWWRGDMVCLSFANHRAGEVLALSDARRRVIATGAARAPILTIDGDQEFLRVFTTNGTATRLTIVGQDPQHVIEIAPRGPITTLEPLRSPAQGSASLITVRSFGTPTHSISIEEILTQGVARGEFRIMRDTRQFDTSQQALPDGYLEEALHAVSSDTTLVPISIIRPASPRGLLVLAYGAYGVPVFAEHSELINSLLKRGIAIARAHVRGGGELGPSWHAAGRASNKARAVQDLHASVRALQSHLGVTAAHTVLEGRSAGAWLVARAALEQPQAIGGVILDAPLLNLTAATSDKSAPLFHRDIAEWGTARAAEKISAWPLPEGQKLPFHIRVIVPIGDELIPAEQTLQWFIQASRSQPAGYTADILTLPHAGHSGPTSASDALLSDHFIREFVSEIAMRP